ncbi:MAG: DUF2267 domain-containing protein [Candidatus Omnitrophota bacterium]
MTRNHSFENTLSKTNEWLKAIEDELHVNDEQKAYQSLRAVIHALRDRLTIEEIADFGAQLPMLIRGLYYEGWIPTEKPRGYKTREEFIENIEKNIPNDVEPRAAVESVFKVIERHVTSGEVDDIKSILPKELLSLWPAI